MCLLQLVDRNMLLLAIFVQHKYLGASIKHPVGPLYGRYNGGRCASPWTKQIWLTAGFRCMMCCLGMAIYHSRHKFWHFISDVLWHRKSTSLRWSDEFSRQCERSTINTNSAVEQQRSSLGAVLMPSSTHCSPLSLAFSDDFESL